MHVQDGLLEKEKRRSVVWGSEEIKTHSHWMKNVMERKEEKAIPHESSQQCKQASTQQQAWGRGLEDLQGPTASLLITLITSTCVAITQVH